MNIDNQKEYWNLVADKKEFTHPLDLKWIEKYIRKNDLILDYGCGYGRIVNELMNQGFNNIMGFDTSLELIKRGVSFKNLPIYHVASFENLPIENETIDLIILFAVLTCIPSNNGQIKLMEKLYSILKPGGILYLSDYYLQKNSKEMKHYEYLKEDKENYGVFTLTEGVTFRHHPKKWIKKLLEKFETIEEKNVEVVTMNKHKAEGFQILVRK